MIQKKYIDYVLSSGLFNIYRCWRKYDYYYSYVNNCYDCYDNIPLDILVYKDYFYYIKKYPRLIAICEKLYKSHSAKIHRVNKRILRMLYNNDNTLNDCLFLTLTFTNDVLLNTSQESRRSYVSRFLKKYSNNYVANIDFGDINGREHYHAVIKCDKVDYANWLYGAINFERIKNTPEKIGTYINKLSAHAVKDSTRFLIYSRNRVG